MAAATIGQHVDGNVINGRSGASSTIDADAHALIPNNGCNLMITKMTVVNRSATDTMITWLSNGVAVWYTPAPKAGGAVEPFPTALALPAKGGLSYQASDAVSTIYVSANGYEINPPVTA